MDDLSNVYDLVFPSPSPLAELAAMEIALHLWRREIQQFVTGKGTLRERYPKGKTSLRRIINLLGLPEKMLPIIERYVVKLADSIPIWLSYHLEKFIFEPEHRVLKHFTNFACDFGGEINYGRTAKRFMTCKGIDNEVKFQMACYYCLEDDILRMWPEMSSHYLTDEFDSRLRTPLDFRFHIQPKVYYWVYKLRNELQKINELFLIRVAIVEHHMLNNAFNDCSEGQWPSLEYFLDRVPHDVAMHHIGYRAHALHSMKKREEYKYTFFRHMLVKLDEPELRKLVNEKGDLLISSSNPFYVMNVWNYIKNEMTNDGFCRLVRYILNEESTNVSIKENTFCWSRLWHSAPDRLKEAAIQDVISKADSSDFSREQSSNEYVIGARRKVSFLLAILSDVPIDDRKIFWNKHWESIFVDLKPPDLCLLVNLCFCYDVLVISEFKKDAVSKNGHKIHQELRKLLGEGFLQDLEEFLTFWYVNEETMKQIRLKLLQDNFTITTELICEASSLDRFIDNAYEDEKLATEFKDKILLVPEMKAVESIKNFVTRGRDFHYISEFIDIFAPSAEIADEIKKHEIVPVFDFFEPHDFGEFENFISWLFESDRKILKFKSTLNVNRLINGWVTDKAKVVKLLKMEDIDGDWFRNCFRTSQMSDSFLKKFFNWFFVTRNAIEKFKNRKYARRPLRYKMLKRLLL